MITHVNNNQRIFWVTGDFNQSVFCNLIELPEVVASFHDKQNLVFKHLWDNKFKPISKKFVISMLEANNIKADFLKKPSNTEGFTNELFNKEVGVFFL